MLMLNTNNDRLNPYDLARENGLGAKSLTALERLAIYLCNEIVHMRWTIKHTDKMSNRPQSTVESEYMALSEAVKQAIWIKHFLFTCGREIEGTATSLIYEDNQGSIKLAANPSDYTKSKHIMVRGRNETMHDIHVTVYRHDAPSSCS